VVAIEALLVLPVLGLIVLGMVELGLLMGLQEQLQAACREGGRVAALGGSEQDVAAAVERHLGGGELSQAQIETVLRYQNGKPVASGDPVEVWVSIPATAVVPDLLWFVGFSLEKQTLVARTVMRKE
jgi:hypothetical protein